MKKKEWKFAGESWESLEDIAEYLSNVNFDLSYDNIVTHITDDYMSQFLVSKKGRKEYCFSLIYIEY